MNEMKISLDKKIVSSILKQIKKSGDPLIQE